MPEQRVETSAGNAGLEFGLQFGYFRKVSSIETMPPKIRDLIDELESAGFRDRGGKGSHRNFVHPRVAMPVTISGNPWHDAKPYQIKAVRRAVNEAKT
jgi:predicted RNA binding protein YcfA (HicA-like mRNA interferase family)